MPIETPPSARGGVVDLMSGGNWSPTAGASSTAPQPVATILLPRGGQWGMRRWLTAPATGKVIARARAAKG
eukprot:2224126-Pyramimonas_sp.AAC.1